MRTLAFSLVLLLCAAACAQPPAGDGTDLKPMLSVFRPAKDDDGLREQAAVGEVVPVPSKPGRFASADASGDYEVTLAHPEARRIVVTYKFTWTGKPDALIASHGIRIPFDFGDLRRTRVAAGAAGRPRGEVWWVDQNDQWHVYWKLGDRGERWPLWRLGGVEQTAPDRCRIWKANRADTPPMVVDRGRACPGWLDVSSVDRGLTVIWDEMPRRAPCSIEVNVPARAIDVWFLPPAAGARSAESLGYAPGKPVTWTFTLAYHDDVFPATQAQELPRKVYAELLRLVDEQRLWPVVAMNYLVPIAGDLDARIRLVVDTGIQPSELLAWLDAGEPAGMERLCAAAGAVRTTDHAANVKAILDYVRGRKP